MDYTALIHGVTELVADASRHRILDARLDEARKLSQLGRHSEAVAAYTGVLKVLKSHPRAWHEVALLHITLGNVESARASLIESIRLDRWNAHAHYDLGRICAGGAAPADVVAAYLGAMEVPDVGDRSLASGLAACSDALQLDSSLENHLRLAHLQIANLQLADAVATLRAAVAAGLETAAVYDSLADAYALLGRDRESQACRGHARYFSHEYVQAVDQYSVVINAGPAEALVYARLVTAYAELHRFSAALTVCHQGIVLHPDDETLACLLAQVLHADGQLEASRQAAAAASRRFPGNMRLRQFALLSLPVVYQSDDEIAVQRDVYANGLDALTQQILVERAPISVNPLHGLGANFLLAYQGRDDKALQVRFGALLHHQARARDRQWSRPIPMRTLGPGERVRVGYVSTNLYRHTVAKLFLGWLTARDPNVAEVFVYHLGGRIDSMTQQYERAADHFRHGRGFVEATGRQIIADQLDILVYLDIGMDDLTTQLAALRLAPVQCVAWGHPVTTGLPTIDYFLSSELMEPAGAEQHYSETLIRLPGIGVNVPPPYLEQPRKIRADFGLSDDDRVYLSPQLLSKYLPRHDELFCRIAAHVPSAKFVFLSAASEHVTDIFKRRLFDAFTAHGLEGDRFLIFLPQQSHRDYLDLNCAADVFLDQPGWSGGMTALEALGCGLPVITWPGAFMRGRHSFAFLRQMDLDPVIASDLDDFVELAVRAGTDAPWREALKRQTVEQRHLLFGDTSSVRELERFYVRCTTAMK